MWSYVQAWANPYASARCQRREAASQRWSARIRMPARMSEDATVSRLHPAPAGYNCGVAANEKLAAYRRKRDFSRTPEPAPAAVPETADGTQRRYVVQRHRARRLHYD